MVISNLIYDIGMHNGADTAYYLKKGFNVIGIEANPFWVNYCKNKFNKEILEDRLTIIERAISADTDSEFVNFYINEEKDDWGSIYKTWNNKDDTLIKKIIVRSLDLNEILEIYGVPYYMKIDIEGADIYCLKAIINSKEKPTYLSTELISPHNLKLVDDALNILSHLQVLGYNRFSISDQGSNKNIQCPYPALEGKFVDHKFDGSSSGLFGKELSGPWYPIDYVSFHYLNYYHSYTKNKLNYLIRLLNKYLKTNLKESGLFPQYSWFDIHATRV